MLLVAGDGGYGLPRAVAGRDRDGAGGRRERHPGLGDLGDVYQGEDVVSGWAVQVRGRVGEWVCAQRRRWDGGAEAAVAGDCRERPGGRADPRDGGEQRRAQRWAAGDAEPDRAAGDAAQGVEVGESGSPGYPLHRDARHGDRGRRSGGDRSGGQRAGSGGRDGALRAGVDQDEHRAYGGGGGSRGTDQDGAGAEASHDSAEPALQGAEPEDWLGEDSGADRRGSGGSEGRAGVDSRRGELVWDYGHECACGARRGAARAGGECAGERAIPADGVGAQPGGAGGDAARAPGGDARGRGQLSGSRCLLYGERAADAS